MANLFAVHAVGSSVLAYLRNRYPAALQAAYPCEFRLLSTGELAKSPELGTTLSLLLYRISTAAHTRNAPHVTGGKSTLPLRVELHYLLSVWADGATAEQVILAWAMGQLHAHSTFGPAELSPEAEWDPDEAIQIVSSELSSEELMKIWDKLDPPYRLSVGYSARVIRMDGVDVGSDAPVIARRMITETTGVGS